MEMQPQEQSSVNISMSTPLSADSSPPAVGHYAASHLTFHISRFTLRVSPIALQVAALTLLAFLLRRYNLGDQSLWFDEADIVQRARQPLSVLVEGFTAPGENGPLYTLLLHYWLGLIDALPAVGGLLHLVFGATFEAPVRGMAMLFGTAAIPVMYALARQVGGHWLGITSAVLLTFNPFHIWHSQDAKMYSLLVLMTLLSTLLYIVAWESNRPALWAGYVLATWVMLTVHGMAGLVLLAQLAATPFFWRSQATKAYSIQSKIQTPRGHPKSKILWSWSMLLVLGPLFPIAWLRFAALVTGTADVGGWYAPTGLLDILQTTFVTFAVNRSDPPWEVIGAVLLAILALLGAFALLRSSSSDASINSIQNPKSKIQNQVLVLALWLVPIAIFWLITLKLPLYQSRYLIMALPPYLIMASAGLLFLRRLHPALMAMGVGALGLVSFVALLGVNYSGQVQKEDWRGAMVYVSDHTRLRDVIVVFPGYLRTAVDLYYEPGGPGRVPDVPIKAVPSLRTEGFGQRELHDALRSMVECHERVWLVTSPPRQKQEDPGDLVQQWFQYNWHTFDTREYNGVMVYGISFNGQPNCWYPKPDHPQVHTFENGLRFLGYIYELRDLATVQSDASYFPLTMYWRATGKLTTDYIVRVRMKGPDGREILDEAGPLNGYWPTSEWPPDIQVIDYRDIRLPGGLTPGNYTITLQLYPKGRPDQPLKLEDGSTEIVFGDPLPVIPWQP